ncbi:MAG: FHA domain-containing protein [Chloroflexi bacterium]|nr:FHA domain-containing protein [Chloroflexota bacterium]
MNPLDQIENRIKELFERSTNLIPWTDQYAILVHRLCEAIQSYLLEENTDLLVHCSGFRVYMNPDDTNLWKSQPIWERTLSEVFTETMTEFGLRLHSLTDFSLIAKNSLDKGIIIISAFENGIDAEKTGVQNLQAANTQEKPSMDLKYGAKLLVNDNKLIPIDKNVLNIGRRSTNDIMINDLRISRTHAQIRKSRNGYVIFDIGSSGGTFINGERIFEHVLRSGDVISLAGYMMIFTDDNDPHAETKKRNTSEILIKDWRKN